MYNTLDIVLLFAYPCCKVNKVDCLRSLCMYIAFSVNQDILNERVKVDRRRIEEAFFQYALLRVTLWYPDQLSMSTLPLHNKTMEILPRIVSVYHGAFMKRHAGNNYTCTRNYV